MWFLFRWVLSKAWQIYELFSKCGDIRRIIMGLRVRRNLHLHSGCSAVLRTVLEQNFVSNNGYDNYILDENEELHVA